MVNLIDALVSYYDQLVANGVDLEPYGWEKRTNVKYVLDIDDDGNIKDIISWSDEVVVTDKKGKEKTIVVARQILVPKMIVRTGGIAPIPLCDTINYLAGIDNKTGKPENPSRKFESFKSLMLGILGDGDGDLAAEAIIKYLSKMTEAYREEIAEKYPEAVTDTGFFVFGYNGRPVTEDYIIANAYNKYIQQVGISGSEMYATDMITGKHGRIARIHGRINSIPAVSGNGAPLCCANAASLESYAGIVGYTDENGYVRDRPEGGAGLHRGYGFPMTEETEHKYITALKYLTASPCHYLKSAELFGNASVLFWAKNATEEQDQRFAALIGMNFGDSQSADKDTENYDIKVTFNNLVSGKYQNPVNDEDPEYIVAAFDSRDGFVMRAKYLETCKLSDITNHIREHYENCSMIGYNGNSSPFAIVRSVLPQKTDGSYKIDAQRSYNDLLKAIVFGFKYPEDVTRQVIDRFLMNMDKKDSVYGGHIAYLRGYLIKNHKKEIQMALDNSINDPAYLMGRIVAYGDYLQYQATQPSPVRDPLSSRYMHEATFYPGVCMPHIINRIRVYCRKLDRSGKGHFYKIGLEEIMARLPSTGWPQRFTRVDQSMFIVGYYQQKQEFFSHKKNDNADTNVAADTEVED